MSGSGRGGAAAVGWEESGLVISGVGVDSGGVGGGRPRTHLRAGEPVDECEARVCYGNRGLLLRARESES